MCARMCALDDNMALRAMRRRDVQTPNANITPRVPNYDWCLYVTNAFCITCRCCCRRCCCHRSARFIRGSMLNASACVPTSVIAHARTNQCELAHFIGKSTARQQQQKPRLFHRKAAPRSDSTENACAHHSCHIDRDRDSRRAQTSCSKVVAVVVARRRRLFSSATAAATTA